MNLITLAQARTHCRADASDDTALTLYANAAEKACAKHANRNLYADQDALDAALAGLYADRVAANAAYEAAILAADEIEIEEDKEYAIKLAENTLLKAQADAAMIEAGIVADDFIIGAVLFTTARFYRFREDAELPQSAQSIMLMYRKVGDL